MRAHHRKPAGAIEPSGSRQTPLPTTSGLTGSVGLGTLLQRARAMLHVQVRPYKLGTVHTLNNRMLTDIGLEADALRCDKPNQLLATLIDYPPAGI
jgi:hypothetical protein